MTHAWLFTGPPGSGRSNAARAFAAALLCEDGGCGECLACRTALAGSHADVVRVVTDQSVIRVDAIRELVRQAALSPAGRRWQILIVEDADRLTDQAADALLKSIEEPPPRTVWLLCAPTVEDVVPTIRSRCRALVLRTPPIEAVAAHLHAAGRGRASRSRSLPPVHRRATSGGRARWLSTRRPATGVGGAPGAEPAGRSRLVYDVRAKPARRGQRGGSTAQRSPRRQGDRRPGDGLRRGHQGCPVDWFRGRLRRTCRRTRSSGRSVSCATPSTVRCSTWRRTTAMCRRCSSDRERPVGQRGDAPGDRLDGAQHDRRDVGRSGWRRSSPPARRSKARWRRCSRSSR